MATAAVPSVAVNGMKMATITQAYLVTKPVRETKLLNTERSCQFTNLRRISAEARNSKQAFNVSPSDVQKEMYLPSSEGTVISWSMRKPFSRLNWSSSFHGPLVTINGATRSGKYSARSAYGGGNMEPVRRCVVLDIEGTTTPISFVTDVLFPYARDSVGRHLSATYDTPETQDDIKLLRAQIDVDLENGVAGAVPVPPESEGKDKVVAALVTNVEAMIKADRKITALKQLQGHIWRTGFQNNELEAVVYEDVPDALERWHASGIKVYIYSSGSRLAQRLIFGNSNFGDLRKYLSGFFDTKVGNKRERQSYVEIAESVGVDSPSEILFVTDVYQEATAAKAAGLDVIVSLRPGNGPLPENHGFKTVTSFSQI